LRAHSGIFRISSETDAEHRSAVNKNSLLGRRNTFINLPNELIVLFTKLISKSSECFDRQKFGQHFFQILFFSKIVEKYSKLHKKI